MEETLATGDGDSSVHEKTLSEYFQMILIACFKSFF